jgi:hypothetical protein
VSNARRNPQNFDYLVAFLVSLVASDHFGPSLAVINSITPLAWALARFHSIEDSESMLTLPTRFF